MQEEKEKKSLFAYVSLMSALLATGMFFFSGENFNVWVWVLFSVTGFFCGIYYLFKGKQGISNERICAILGTAISGLWLLMIFGLTRPKL